MSDLGKIIVVTGFENAPKVPSINRPIWSPWSLSTSTQSSSSTSYASYIGIVELWSKYSTIVLKMGQTRTLFLFIFVLFSHHMDKYSINLTINEKREDGMLGSRTQGGNMEGADKSTELWQHPNTLQSLFTTLPRVTQTRKLSVLVNSRIRL